MLRSKPSGVNPATKTSGSPKSAAERQRAAREKGLRIKQLQKSAQAALPQHKLYINLYIRSYPPCCKRLPLGILSRQDSIWRDKVPHQETRWWKDCWSWEQWWRVQVTTPLRLDRDWKHSCKQRREAWPNHEIPRWISGVTCRVWVLRIIPLLIQAGLLRCNDLAGLQECFDYGNACMNTAAANFQPRPVRVSSRCS